MTTNDDEPPDLLTRLNKLHPTAVVIGTLALFLGVLLLPDPVGAVLVVAVATGLGWLLTRTWPVLAPAARRVRLAVIGLLLVVALLKLLA